MLEGPAVAEDGVVLAAAEELHFVPELCDLCSEPGLERRNPAEVEITNHVRMMFF